MKHYTKTHLKSCIDHFKCTQAKDHAAGKHSTPMWWCDICVTGQVTLADQMTTPIMGKLNMKKKTRARKILDKLLGIKCRSCDYNASSVDELLDHERSFHDQYYAGSNAYATAMAVPYNNVKNGPFIVTSSGISNLNRGT